MNKPIEILVIDDDFSTYGINEILEDTNKKLSKENNILLNFSLINHVDSLNLYSTVFHDAIIIDNDNSLGIDTLIKLFRNYPERIFDSKFEKIKIPLIYTSIYDIHGLLYQDNRRTSYKKLFPLDLRNMGVLFLRKNEKGFTPIISTNPTNDQITKESVIESLSNYIKSYYVYPKLLYHI